MRVTILVTFSKPEYAYLTRENLLNLELGNNEVDLVIVCDSVEFETASLAKKYQELNVVHLHEGKPVTKNIPGLRTRIAEVRNQSRQHVTGEMVFSFEDDMELPKNALVKMLDDYKKLSKQCKVGLISGLQVGRHSRRIIGAWHVQGYQFPQVAYSLGHKDIVTPLAEVDGTGFYCFLTPASLYKSVTFGWYEPFGPDVWYGLWLRTRGYVNYVDQSIVCPHLSGDKRYVPDDSTIKLKVYQDSRGQWINEPVKSNMLAKTV